MTLHLNAYGKGVKNGSSVAPDRKLLAVDVPYTNLQWTRRLFEAGEFSVQMPVETYSEKWDVLEVKSDSEREGTRSGHYELGLILRRELTAAAGGAAYVTLSGYMMDKLIDGYVIADRFYTSQKWTMASAMRTMLRTLVPVTYPYKDIITCDTAANRDGDGTANYTPDVTAISLGNHLRSVMQGRGLGIAAGFSKLKIGEPYAFFVQGYKDRTMSAVGDNSVIFGLTEPVTGTMSIASDESTAYRGYQANTIVGDTPTLVNVTNSGLTGNEVWLMGDKVVDGIQRLEQSTGQTDAQTLSSFTDDLRNKLADLVTTEDLEVDATIYGAEYVDKFDLGDKVTVFFSPLSRFYDTQIIEIEEVAKAGSYTATLRFGTKRLTNIQRAVQR